MCWVAQLWKESASPDIYKLLPSQSRVAGFLIDWEDNEVQQSIQHEVDFFLKECIHSCVNVNSVDNFDSSNSDNNKNEWNE